MEAATQERPLEEQSDAELMQALVGADRAKVRLVPLLKARALALLSKVPGFPWEGGMHREKVDEKHVDFDLAGTGHILVNVPVYWMEEERQQEIKRQLKALPGVEVEADGAFVTGLHSWIVKIDPSKLLTSAAEPAGAGEVRREVDATLRTW